jgi:hypothetical protein
MGTVTIKKQSGTSVTNPATDQLRLFVDSADSILKTKDSLGVIRPSGVGTATDLATSTINPVAIDGSAPSGADEVLTTDSAVAATWKALASLYLSGTPVLQGALVTGPATPTVAISTLVPVDVSAGAVTINLPTAASNVDKEIWVKLVSVATFTCTVDAFGAETIDGALTLTLTTNFEWVILRSDGTNWMQLG